MTATSKHLWYQFSLKTLLVGLTLLCIGPGGYVAYEQAKARRQKAAVEAIERLGGTVDYFEKPPVRSATMRQILGNESFGNKTVAELGKVELTDADLEHISALKHLEYLSLYGTKVTDAGLVHLAGLNALKVLELDDTQVTGSGLVHLTGLKCLTRLSLRSTQVSDDDLVSFAGLTNLEMLWLDRTTVSGSGLAHLAELRTLTYLSLNETEVNDNGLVQVAKLRTLTTLSLAGTQVSDAGLMHLASLKNLRDLSLPPGVSIIGHYELQRALPNCHISISPYKESSHRSECAYRVAMNRQAAGKSGGVAACSEASQPSRASGTSRGW